MQLLMRMSDKRALFDLLTLDARDQSTETEESNYSTLLLGGCRDPTALETLSFWSWRAALA